MFNEINQINEMLLWLLNKSEKSDKTCEGKSSPPVAAMVAATIILVRQGKGQVAEEIIMCDQSVTFPCWVNYKLSEEGRKRLLSQRVSAHSDRQELFDLPVRLLDLVSVNNSGDARIELSDYQSDLLTQAALVAILDQKMAKDAEESAEKRAKMDGEIELAEQILRQIEVAGGIPDNLRISYSYVRSIDNDAIDIDYTRLPKGIEVKFRELYKQQELRHQAKEAKRNEENRQMQLQKEQEMRKWAETNGSEQLKQMLEFGDEFEWQVIAENEWFGANKPEQFSLNIPEELDDARWERRSFPTVEELQALLQLRNICVTDSRFRNPLLQWVRAKNVHLAALQVDLVAPSGKTRECYKFFEETRKEIDD